MKIYVFTLLLLFFGCHTALFAQGFSFESMLPINEIIPVEGKGFLLSSSPLSNSDSLVLVYFNQAAKPQSSVTIPLKRKIGALILEDIFVWNNKVVVLKSLFYAGRQTNHLLLYEYRLPDLQLINSEQLTTAHHPFDLRLPFYYNLSPDSSKLLVTIWSFFASDSLAQMELKIFDQDWQELETRQAKLPYRNEKISIYGCRIDDDANCYIIGDVYTGNNLSYANPKQITEFVIASFQNSKSLKSYQIKDEKINIQSWCFDLDHQQNLVLFALYSEGMKVVLEGSTFYKIDKSTKTIRQFTQTVDKESFIAAFEKSNLGFKTPRNRFVSYTLKEVVLKKDAYYLIAENLNLTTDEMRDILVMSIDLDGQLQWMRRLPKAQQFDFGANTFASFAIVEQEENLLFFYNGNAKNFEADHDDRVKSTTPKMPHSRSLSST
ncbi:MAG: hypothetical protein AAGG68_01690 [Bacteroidota bacterium]